jgi:ankyrin repeat protein
MPLELPDRPSLEWLRKQARKRLAELRQSDAAARLTDAQFALAKAYGFSSWRALKAHVDRLTIDGRLIDSARNGDVETLTRLLDAHPDKRQLKVPPYDASLLFPAVEGGSLEAVQLLIARGLDVNYRERGDNTYAMHWAAARGDVRMVRALADAGGDVIGEGDDHAGGVIGWATCWDGCDDAAHRAVVDLLVERGARHHIFSAIAMNLADEVRRIVSADRAALNQRQSRNENHLTPLHFAVKMKRPQMVALLVALGADPLAVDGAGMPVATFAAGTDIDLPVMRRIREMTLAELDSAVRGHRAANVSAIDLVAAIAVRDWDTATKLATADRRLTAGGGALHLLAKRGDATGVKWMLDQGADPDALWAHWDADVTALHLAAAQGHAGVARLLLDRGADATIRDSRHESDPLGWAEFFGKPEVVQLLRAHAGGT